jgi:ubiquinone/menaquinone biosynthesis C-methylase UbiE
VRASSLEIISCPACGGQLNGGSDAVVEAHDASLQCAGCGRVFSIRGGIADLVFPEVLQPSDADFQRKYDEGAEGYDSGLEWMWKAFAVDEDTVRTAMIDLLDLEPGSRVIETGCGTGQDSVRIVERIGSDGMLFAQDLSRGMIDVASRRLEPFRENVELVQTNAAYLPFVDDAFDAAYHFGGINTFGERRRAIAEMARVVRPGRKVVLGDEGIAPWLRRKLIGRILVNANPLYAHRAPLDELPETALEPRIQWIIGNAFYVIDFRVGDAPPSVALDLPIPGKGDTLRSRYYGAK